MSGLRRLILPVLALALLAGVVWWLVSRPVVRFRLGAGDELVALPGADGFAVREAEGLWRLYDAAARAPEDGVLLPAGLRDRPAIARDGGAWVLADGGLLRVPPVRGAGGVRVALSAESLPADARLLGLADGTQPVLSGPALSGAADGARGLFVLVGGDGADDAAPDVVALRDARGPAVVPADAAEGDAFCAPGGPALALRTPAGWEAWRWDATGAGRRFLAEGCLKPGAVFAPDAHALIVPGRVDGLWTMDLSDGRLAFMAEGNLGVSRRVPSSAAFRYSGEHTRLVAPQWNIDGWLQVYQSHLFGGGRWAFGLSFTHHYGVVLSSDERLLSYCQARFQESSDEPFEEKIYVFDFSDAADTVYVGSRPGGRGGQGPCFVGAGASLVYLADGDVLRIEMLPESGKEK